MKDLIFLLLILIYTSSIVFYILGLFRNRVQYTKFAYYTLVAGGLVNFFIFIVEMLSKQYVPILTIDQVLVFYSLLIVWLTIMIHHYIQIELLEFSTVFISIVLLVTRLNIGELEPVIESSFLSKLLFIHIVLTIVSYVLFALSAIFSGMYLLHHYLLKNKVWNILSKKLPSLERLDKNMVQLNLIGFPLFFLGLFIGSLWAGTFFKYAFFIDVKVIMSFVILGMYGYLLLQKKRGKWGKKQLASWNLVAFVMVLLNFFLSHQFWSFHQWLTP